jgi:NAD(P)-dependent dehydrogenase (short-subunit alcohol dehydrogenase family)
MGFYWITGASGVMGSAIAARLNRRGFPLLLTGRSGQKLDELATILDGATGQFELVVADATNETEMNVALERGRSRFGVPLGGAACVGSILLRPLHLTSLAELRQAFETNLTSAWLFCDCIVRAALDEGTGASLVLMGSSAASAGYRNHECIGALKAAVGALAVSAAATYARNNIRFNCIHPGLTRSALSASILRSQSVAEALARDNPLGRLGDGNDAASLAEFLLLDDSRWITGQQINVDGGQSKLHVGRGK